MVMGCGHPPECLNIGDEGTIYCRWCEDVGRLKEDLRVVTANRDFIYQVLHRAHLELAELRERGDGRRPEGAPARPEAEAPDAGAWIGLGEGVQGGNGK